MNVFSIVKSRIPILDLIQSYTTLKRAGLYWKGHCPFHSEKTASFTVSPHKEIFYCFGCHEHGDVISFIAKIENYSLLEAARFLADRYNIDLPDTPLREDKKHKKDHYFELCFAVAQWSHKQLNNRPAVHTYLKKRGISRESIDQFMIGYFPGGFKAIRLFIQEMKKVSIIADDLLQAYILQKGKNTLYSPFEERILFPIKDHLGRFCGFGGRVFKTQDNRPKYYNSHESDYFNKGGLLFGLDLAKKEIQKKGTAFLVEGYTDCIAMHQNGYSNTVATLGTACTLGHLQLLSRYAQGLTIVYDNDSAGQHALLRLTELCWQATLDLTVVQLPQGEDPSSYLQSHSLESILEKPIDIFTFFIQQMGTDFLEKPLSIKLDSARKIIAILHKIDDPLKRDILLQKAASTLNIPYSSLKKESDKTLPASTKQTHPSREKSSDSAINIFENLKKLSKKVFFAILQNITLLKTEQTEDIHIFLVEPWKMLLGTLKKMQSTQAEPISFSQFFDTLDEKLQKELSHMVLQMEDTPAKDSLEELMGQLKKIQWKRSLNSIKQELEKAKQQGNSAQISQLLEKLIVLRKKL